MPVSGMRRSCYFPRMLRIVVLSLIAIPQSASAHGLGLTTTAGDEAIAGRAAFADGSPVAQAGIELVAVRRDAAVVTTRTDADGRFALPTPLVPGEYRLSVDDGLGHRREKRLTIDRPAIVEAATVVRVLDAPVTEQAHGHRHGHLSRWLSGLGYLLGLSGAAAWWLARRESRRLRD
jgi:hypothetical protein